ncbi:glucose dehydrogenase [FAD, quinone]-like [Ciona intestinalis]
MLKQFLLFCVVTAFLPRFLTWYYSVTINQPDEEYDFIIVGAGTTGNVIANRLTESSNVRVLVVEAGDNAYPNPLLSIPLLVPFLQQTSTDWMYRSEPQQHACKEHGNRVSLWPRGKVIGGSSCYNYMMYVRGDKHDYDEWAEEGAIGWDYKNILPFFKKSQNVGDPELSKKYHGTEGFIKTGYSYTSPMAETFIKAGQKIGYESGDYNAENTIGFHRLQSSIHNGLRQSSNEYLGSIVQERSDRLHIVGRAHVRQIVFEEGEDGRKRASGVIYVRDDVEVKVRARKEVIVSGGAVGSPQLLMLSGIGPKQHLNDMGIKLAADLPGVGQNMQDHVMAMAPFYGSKVPSKSTINDFTLLTGLPDYLMGNEGPLATCGIDATAFIRSPITKRKSIHSPDIQFIQLSAEWSTLGSSLNQKIVNIGEQVMEKMYETAKVRGSRIIYNFVIYNVLIRPRSVGEIKLRTNSYKDHPIIQPNYLSNQTDVDTMIEGYRVLEKLEQTKQFKDIEAKMDFSAMGCGDITESPRSAEFYECVIRAITLNVYHAVGTAKIGAPEDVMAVVDPRLRVYKVDGLRVADASVMPSIPSANTQAACYMIGEKAADMIKEDWKL